MLFIILLILGLAIYLPLDYGRHEGEADAAKIAANKSLDTLKERFHANNLIKRSAVALAVTGLATFGLHITAGFSWWFALFYGVYFTAAFGFMFTTSLNAARGLPRFYVSHSPRAAEMDKFMVRGSAAFGMQPQSFSRLLHMVFLLAGILLLGAGVWIFWG